ncbi:ATP-grasp fold amidoligase family protein [Marinomonas sp. FW-1]|uniref:CapA family protein n=1 Tax=Marinomonas sp. FW-1 TaxID=2071621 RepID=UPI0010BFA6FC|nr:ATP-grasp fold amidoligase family protein [Marinomonas sp. FW-1]
MTIYSFTGDLILQGLDNSDVTSFFDDIREEIDSSLLVVNLESPFVDQSCDIPLKNKVTLSQPLCNISILEKLNPYLVTLSNNHINDYGNNSVELTKKTLLSSGFNASGVGKKNDLDHVFIDRDSKVIIVSYTTRETDLTGSFLHAEEEVLGPKDISFSEISELRNSHKDFKLIVNLHWGVEYIPYPLPTQRSLAYRMIDAGVDLIIGHHSHIIQPYEVYKGKYIFYSLGNFLFPDVEFYLNGKKEFMFQSDQQCTGLLCKFDIEKNEIISLKKVKRELDNSISILGDYNRKLTSKNDLIYSFKYAIFKYKQKYHELRPLIPKVKRKLIKEISKNLSDYWYFMFKFIRHHKYVPNFKKPRTFSEKINHIKLYKIDELREKVVDRIWVRNYVKELASECSLIPILWKGKSIDRSIWDSLPNEFVIKGNHGSGMVKVVDKSTDSFHEVLDLTRTWMKTDYASIGREWFYNKVDKLLIVEEKLVFDDNIPPDFKFFCFNGRVEVVQVDSDRFSSHKRNMYDANFENMGFELCFPEGVNIKKPASYDQAVRIASNLSKDFDFIRVDLYIIEDKVFFGELTNIPGNGLEAFKPRKFDYLLGKRLNLNE